MIVLVLLRQLKPVHFYMQVFEQVHLLLCQRLELWWTTSSVVHEVVADVATTKADADGIVWHREKPADIVTAPVIKSFGDKRDVFYAACKREEVGCWIFQVEMFEFESIHELGDQLDIKKAQGNASSQRNRVVFNRAPVKWSVMSLDVLKFWIKDHSAIES